MLKNIRKIPLLRPGGLVAALAVAAVVSPAPAYAHDTILSSTPDANSTLEKLPKELVLEFSAEPQEGYNTIALSRDGQSLFSEQNPALDGHTFTVPIPDNVESEPGTYTVGYQITSSDGHATRGGFEFTIAGETSHTAAADASSTANEGESADSQNAVPNWLLPLGGIIVLVGALAIAIKRWRDMN